MLKHKIATGETVVGTFVFLPSPGVVEILALAGMDFIIIDMEHSPKDWDTLEHMIRAANLHKLPALIRVSQNSEKLILQCLEIGADGIVVPFVRSAEDVRSALDAVLYPPDGRRGTCTLTRMTGYGAHRSRFLEHCREQNERLVVLAQIEDSAGVEQIGPILACRPSLDAVLVGRSDLASSFGTPGQTESPAVLEATEVITEAARAADGPRPAIAMGIYSRAEVERWKKAGCTVFFAPSDGILLLNAAQGWLNSVRDQAPAPRVPASGE
jgi:4-hydroxy-2-oxoheptanedioate aldolase